MRRKHIWLIGAIMGGLTGVIFGCSQEQGFVEPASNREIYSETIEGCETMEIHETIASPTQEPAKETEEEEKEPEIAVWETMSLEQLLQEKRYPAALAWIRARKSQEWDDLEVKLQERIAGDFIVAGTNFGCGSSREHAPIALKGVGVAGVIAESFARIFYRNATNVGVPLLEAPGITEIVEDGDEIEVDMDEGTITASNGKTIEFKKLPPFMLEILEQGGLIEYLKNKR